MHNLDADDDESITQSSTFTNGLANNVTAHSKKPLITTPDGKYVPTPERVREIRDAAANATYDGEPRLLENGTVAFKDGTIVVYSE